MSDVAEQVGTRLAGIDVTIIIMYMGGVFLLGTFFGKYVKNAGDFFIAGKALPFWAIGMSIVVSDIGAMDFVAVSGGAFSDGISVANFDWMGSMPAMVFAAFVFIPYFWRAGVYSIPEFLGRRYNTGVRVIHGTIWAIFLFVMLSLMLWVTGDKLFGTILGWNPHTVVWLMVFISGVYTVAGGLSAVVMVDVVQLVFMFVGGIALLALSMWEVGGPAGLREQMDELNPRAIIEIQAEEQIPFEDVQANLENAGFRVEYIKEAALPHEIVTNKFLIRFESLGIPNEHELQSHEVRRQTRQALTSSLGELADGVENVAIVELLTYTDHLKVLLPHDTDKPYPWTGIVFGLGIVLAIAYMSGNQAVVQRTLGARSEWDAKGGMLFGGLLKSFVPLMVAVPGLCALILAPDLPNAERAVPYMIATLLPPGLRGLMFVAFFAALMSSVDSNLNSSTTIWTNDLYGRMYHLITGKNLGERHGLIMGRIFTLIFIVLAGALAEFIGRREGLYVFIQTALSIFQGPTLAILLLGIIWRRTTQWGGLAGLVLGVIFTTILNSVDGLFPSDNPFLFVAWWSFVFSLIVTIIVSLLTPPEPDEKIRGLVWGHVMKDAEMQHVLHDRVSE